MDRIHLAWDSDKPPTTLMQWFNWHFHFFQHSVWFFVGGGGGGTELAVVETFLEFHIPIQTNILANHLSITQTGNSPGETSGLKMVAVEIVEFCFWRGTWGHNSTCYQAQSSCIPTEVSTIYFAALLVDTINCQIEFLISQVMNFAHTSICVHTHTHTHTHEQIFCEMQSRSYSWLHHLSYC